MQRDRGYEVYAGNLNDKVSEEMLYHLFTIHGMIQSVKIMRDIVTHKSRGFGFVNFRRFNDAERAINALNNQLFMGKSLRVYFKTVFQGLNKQANVLLTNIASGVTENDLDELCGKFGQIFSIKLTNDDEATSGQQRAYVQFLQLESSQKCIDELNGTDFRGFPLKIEPVCRTDMLYIKGRYSPDFIEDLKSQISRYGKVELGEIELLENDRFYMTTLSFEKEKIANAFQNDFMNHKSDC